MARVFSIACVALTLPLAPMLFLTPASVRQHPLPLAGGVRRLDGSVIVHRDNTADAHVTRVKIDDGAWLAAGSAAIGRKLRNLPPGTRIGYYLESGRQGVVVEGTVTEERGDSDFIAARLVRAILAIFFLIAGLALATAGQNQAALYAAGLVAGAGAALGTVFLEPAVVHLSSQGVRDVVIAASVGIPSTLWCYYLLAFMTVFPTTLRIGRPTRFAMRIIASLAVARGAFLAIAQAASLFDSLPWRAQFSVIRLLEGGVLQNACYFLCSVSGIYLLVRQARAFRTTAFRSDVGAARRASMVVGTVIAGFAPVLIAVLIQVTWLILRKDRFFTSLQMSLLLIPLVLVPAALWYALLARRVQTVGIVARRAALFVVAENTIAGAAVLPLLAIGWIVYRHRKEPLDHIFTSHPIALTSAIVAAAAALRYAHSAHDLLERFFFRERREARNVLRALADKSRSATSATDLGHLLVAEIDAAFHLESIAIFTRDRSSERFVTEGGPLPPIDGTSTIVSLLNQTHEIIDVDPAAARRALHNLSEVERHWLVEGQVRLIVPLIASDGSLLALLAVGEKMDELPFTAEDRGLLAAVAGSAALVLENHLLRIHSAPAGAIAMRYDGELSDRVALRCQACRRLYSPLLRTICPDDDLQLVPAQVPYLLSGKYRFEAEIGAGGMGVVYRARDLSLGRGVAVKTLPKVSTETLARLRREARAAANLSHPNLATIFAAESWEGVPMLVFELLDGGTLRERLALTPLSIGAVIEIGIQLCDGLAAAHGIGILHRDIKPANIGFSSSGVPKLLDFGLAKFFEISLGENRPAEGPEASTSDTVSFATGPSGLLGTPSYLSPEAVMGEPIHPDFDVWSLTLTLYEAIAGRNPFIDPSPARTMNMILREPAPDLRRFRSDCPASVAEVFRLALARDRESRPRSAADLRARLSSVM